MKLDIFDVQTTAWKMMIITWWLKSTTKWKT